MRSKPTPPERPAPRPVGSDPGGHARDDREDDTPAFVAELLAATSPGSRPGTTAAQGAIEEAEILTWSGDTGTLTDNRPARSGFSCLVRPAPGDRVLIWSGGEAPCVLSILRRTDPEAVAVLAMSRQTSIEAPHLALSAQTVCIAARDFLTSARNRHIVEDTRTETSRLRVTHVGTDIRRVTTSDDTVDGTLLQRAGTWISTTVRDARLTARTFLFS